MAAGYSGKPLAEKLGIKPGTKVAALGAPPNYRTLLGALPSKASITSKAARGDDFVHLFVKSQAELHSRLPALRKSLARDGTLWVSWPKKSSGPPTDITEDVIREFALPMGFVDIKVCAVDETWSGLKLVIRKELRR